MAYSVKQVAAMSGVSVRTLHFYDQTGLLKPAYQAANGYRFYEEPQLLMLQQILFYRELGFKLKDIRQIATRGELEKVATLRAHREVLQENLARTRMLLDTIENTIRHVEGGNDMKNEDLFTGFCVAAGQDRLHEQTKLGGEPNDCKVAAQDTSGAMCVFEFTGTNGGPRHLHHQQDEWLYVIEGEILIHLGNETRHLRAGESAFIPRGTAHGWVSEDGRTAKVLDLYQPAGKMEQFFREVGKYTEPPIHEVLKIKEMRKLFADHGMDLLPPAVAGQWKVDEQGRIVKIA